MNVAMIAEMAAEAGGDRVALNDSTGAITYSQLWDRSRRAAGWLNCHPQRNVVMIGVNSRLFPITFFGASLADRSFAPLNYRWTDAQLVAAVRRLGEAIVVADDVMLPRLSELTGEPDVMIVGGEKFLESVDLCEQAVTTGALPQRPAVQLFTSGTSGTPKVAVLEHANLAAYIFGTVELMAAEEGDTQLVSLPPYHVGGIANLLSTLYSGRQMVQLDAFDPAGWVNEVRRHGVTHASVVPTMLARIMMLLADDEAPGLPSLRHLSYGGGRMPLPVLDEAMRRLPHVGFVNGYGLTETSSTITVLDPDDHRKAAASDDPAMRARLGSVGRALPTVELSVRDGNGRALTAGELGELWVRGDQVSGRYVGGGPGRDEDGWFRTKDAARIDADGYVFIEGRLDDVIVRGGENISPGEVEDELIRHPDVLDAGVVGLTDDDWGERIAAAVVAAPGRTPDPAALQEWVRSRLRSSKAPSTVDIVDALPYNDNGKLMRRTLREQLSVRGPAISR